MQKKLFWVIYIVLSLIADFTLPLIWSLIMSVPLLILSWWVAFRSGWIE
jgi:hypothetical protein